ncbi:hypothetical protein G6F43_002270 [Rhizopus delemar]|nr:hypothetical protein G6F43_002270 [Rhizopus delemar]
MGDACSNTTISAIQALNQNLVTSPSMMSQPSIALVRRGGRCSAWSEKLATVQSLSDSYRLQITAAVIYDDLSYQDTTIIHENTDNASYPVWQSPEVPKDRNATWMTDENKLDLGTTFLAVYFVPYSYIDSLNKTYLQKNFERSGNKQTFTQLTFSLYENHFTTTNEDLGTSGSGDKDDYGNAEEDKPTFVIYSVAIIVAFILVVIVLRWCRAVRRTASDDIERLPDSNLLSNDQQTTKHLISFLDLHQLCPMTSYGKASMTNSVCAICLDDFKDDFYVRVLPCHHGYCTACIDVWLTKKSSLCPICKSDCKNFLAKEES